MKSLTKRQANILKFMIDRYVVKPVPISSQYVRQCLLPNSSAATVRAEMNFLEKNNLLIKRNVSAGRAPTLEAYKYYDLYLNSYELESALKRKLENIFNRRKLSIDEVINDAVSVINKLIGIPFVITKNYACELLKQIDIVNLDERNYLLLLVTSSGKVIKKTLKIHTKSNFRDIKICINIFNERLINVPINKLVKEINVLKEVICEQVSNYEEEIQEKVFKLFSNLNFSEQDYKNEFQTPELLDLSQFQHLISLLNDVSIWNQIKIEKEEIDNEYQILNKKIGLKDTSLITTNISFNNMTRQIATYGPDYLVYTKVTALLHYLKQGINKKIEYEKKK